MATVIVFLYVIRAKINYSLQLIYQYLFFSVIDAVTNKYNYENYIKV
ncbi:hypothetical protein ABID22_002135 [Pontibacter aydingkolensis]